MLRPALDMMRLGAPPLPGPARAAMGSTLSPAPGCELSPAFAYGPATSAARIATTVQGKRQDTHSAVGSHIRCGTLGSRKLRAVAQQITEDSILFAFIHPNGA